MLSYLYSFVYPEQEIEADEKQKQLRHLLHRQVENTKNIKSILKPSKSKIKELSALNLKLPYVKKHLELLQVDTHTAFCSNIPIPRTPRGENGAAEIQIPKTPKTSQKKVRFKKKKH